MLDVLNKIILSLPALLKDEDSWNTVFIDYEKPQVERLWRSSGENRIYLHKIYPCTVDEAFFHPHPWPSAILLLEGTYEMGVGFGKGMEPPPIAATVLLSAGSTYEMIHPDSWH